MSYELVVRGKVRKAISRLPTTALGRVVYAIDSLALAPRPRGSKRLQGTPAGIEDRRLRVGDYRIIYRVQEPHPDYPENQEPEDEEGAFDGLVTVLDVGHRQGIYRGR